MLSLRTFLLALMLAIPVLPTVRAQNAPPAQVPNYELASQWTTEKINKVVFDVGVTPHWLETGDRFWYSYETRDGKRYFIVDPL